MVNFKRKIYWSKEFDSSHFLYLPYDSKCLRIHGHSYKVEIEIWGDLNENGMIFDFNHLSEIIKGFDHKVLIPKNAVEFQKDVVEAKTQRGSMLIANKGEYIVLPGNATAEVIAEYIWKEIMKRAGDNVSSVRVRVWEDPRSYAEVWA